MRLNQEYISAAAATEEERIRAEKIEKHGKGVEGRSRFKLCCFILLDFKLCPPTREFILIEICCTHCSVLDPLLGIMANFESLEDLKKRISEIFQVCLIVSHNYTIQAQELPNSQS